MDPLDLTEIYFEYLQDSVIQDQEPYCSDAFRNVFHNGFPDVHIRQYKSVAGKCDICERLKALQKVHNHWNFDHKYVWQRIIIKRNTGADRSMRKNVIMAHCKNDANEGDLYKVYITIRVWRC